MRALPSTQKRVVLVGGGHTHALFLRMAAMQPLPQTELVLVSDGSDSAYSGMLPGYVAGRYREDELFIDLRRLCDASGAVFIRAAAEGLDLKARQVLLTGRPPLAFDLLSLNVGSTPSSAEIEGAERWGVPVKPLGPFLAHWRQVVERAVRDAAAEQIVIAGGGAGGVELALAMHARLQGRAKVCLVQSATTLLPHQAAAAGRRLAKELHRRGIRVLLGTKLQAVTASTAHTADGQTLPYTALYLTTSASAPSWFKASGLTLDAHGFAAVAPTLACIGQRDLFAVGDCAAVLGSSAPKAGVFAVRQGPPLYANIRSTLLRTPLRSAPRKTSYLALIGLADGRALATRRHWALTGAWILRWKEAIDRRFMARFTALPVPAMQEAAPGPELAAAMRCHGCGAKVGGGVLSAALNRIEEAYPTVVRGPKLAWGLAAREDTSWLTLAPGQQLLQSIDYFPSLVSDPFLAGRLACIHAFSDILAKGATPHSAHVLAVMALAAPHLTAERLYQTLAGIATELALFGAQLAGGHTAEGEQAALGLMVNGTLGDAGPLRKDGGRPGDALLLTKPLGTGLIFAAAMQGIGHSAWIDGAIASMLRSHRELSSLMTHPGIHAATDITGFGLVGHLSEMLRSGALSARIDGAAVPCLAGARALAERGVASSLYPANSQVFTEVAWATPPGPLGAIWADPQTCGGLLLSVDAAYAPELLAQIQALGYGEAALIGTLGKRGAQDGAIHWS